MDINGRSGALGMTSGDVCFHESGRYCVAGEFLQDGDAFVTWHDGSHGTVKWRSLCRVSVRHMSPYKSEDA